MAEGWLPGLISRTNAKAENFGHRRRQAITTARPLSILFPVRLEEHHGQGWSGKQDGMRLTLPRRRFGVQAAGISHITAAYNGRVTVEELAIKSWCGHADAVALPRHGREISQHHHEIVGIPGAANERDDAVVHIVKVDPLKAFPAEVDLVQGGLLDINLLSAFTYACILRWESWSSSLQSSSQA